MSTTQVEKSSETKVPVEYLKTYLSEVSRLTLPVIYHQKMILTDEERASAIANVKHIFTALSVPQFQSDEKSNVNYTKYREFGNVEFNEKKGTFTISNIKLHKNFACTINTGYIFNHCTFKKGKKLSDFILLPRITKVQTTDGKDVEFLQNVIAKEKKDMGLFCISFIAFDDADNATVTVNLQSFNATKLENQAHNVIKAKNRNPGDFVVNFSSYVDFSTTKVENNVLTIDAKDREKANDTYQIKCNIKVEEPILITGRRREPKYKNYITSPGMVLRLEKTTYTFPNQVFGDPGYMFNTNTMVTLTRKTKPKFSEADVESLFTEDRVKYYNGSIFTPNDTFLKGAFKAITSTKALKNDKYDEATKKVLQQLVETEALSMYPGSEMSSTVAQMTELLETPKRPCEEDKVSETASKKLKTTEENGTSMPELEEMNVETETTEVTTTDFVKVDDPKLVNGTEIEVNEISENGTEVQQVTTNGLVEDQAITNELVNHVNETEENQMETDDDVSKTSDDPFSETPEPKSTTTDDNDDENSNSNL